MSNTKKLLIALTLAIGLLPTTAAAQYCFVDGHTGMFPGTCNPADDITCEYHCAVYCNDKCPPYGSCAYLVACESGGWTCHCWCEYPCQP